jgi:hypothetical protein
MHDQRTLNNIMKITLDLSRLLQEGRITPAEADRLKVLAAHETGSLGLNILVGFGVISVSAGAVAFLLAAFDFSIVPVVVAGAVLFALGLALSFSGARHWELLAQICIVVGALTLCGGLYVLDKGSLRVAVAVTAGLAAAAILARSSLLTALSVLSLAGIIGASTGYSHATYSLTIEEPTVTIVLFSALALGAYLASRHLSADYERIAITASRTALFLINFGFWIGSLWGDSLRLPRAIVQNDPTILGDFTAKSMIIPPKVFSIGWAVALIAVAIWGVKENRRWVVNLAAIFGAIHFYTQWFAKLGANPLSVLLAGVLMLGIALGLRAFNRQAPAAA